MSLLMKALKKVERGPGSEGGAGWSLEPLENRGESQSASGAATPRSAQAAADLIRAREASREGMRLAVLLGALLFVVVGMGGYFYVAVYMPWLLLPKPAAAPVAGPAPTSAPVLASAPVETVPPLEVAPPPRAEPVAPTAAPQAAPTVAAPAEQRPLRQERPAARREAESAVRAATAAASAADGLLAAYELLQAGQYEQARQAYERLRTAQPANADVLLGLAVIAQNQNRSEEAAQLYLRALELEPRNTFAQAGLVGLIGRADPAAAEARLKPLIQQQPAAYLHFALGNVYASQGRWSEAQSAYFEAQRLDPDSADYAFNLAVSLEHLDQPRSAAEYYQRALRLAQGKTAIHFDPAQARSRLQKLSR